MTETNPEHDAEISVCGEVYLIRRTHELLRRMESVFGPLIPLANRVETLNVRQSEIALIYGELVRGDRTAPSRADLERWIWEEGTPKTAKPLVRLLLELPIGNATLRAIEEEKRMAAAEQAEARERARPTEPAATPAATGAAATTDLAEAIAAALTTRSAA